MNKMVGNVWIIILLMTFSLSEAQKIDKRSDTLLKEVLKNYKSKDNIFFGFVYSTNDKFGSVKKERGSLYLSGEKYRLEIMEVNQIFDGVKVYNINEKDKEITISKPQKDDLRFSPIVYLEEYRKDYDISYVESKDRMSDNAIVKLTPIDPKSVKFTYLYINSKTKKLVKSQQYFSENDFETIEIEEYTENKKLDSSFFNFNKRDYSDYLITEL